MTINTAEIIIRNMELIDLFIQEEFVKVSFESLTPKEQIAHTKAVSDIVMKHILHTPLEVFCMPVDKFERDRINEEIIEKYLEHASLVVKPLVVVKKKTRPINPLRHNADGTYNSHCLDPEYAHNYYNEKLKGVVCKCSSCGSEVLRTNLGKHKRSKKCQLLSTAVVNTS